MSLFSTKVREFRYKKQLGLFLFPCFINAIAHYNKVEVVCFISDIFLACIAIVLIYEYCFDFKSCYKFIVIAGLLNIAALFFQHYLKLVYKFNVDGNFAHGHGGLMQHSPRLSTLLVIILPFMLFVPKIGWFLFGLTIFACISYQLVNQQIQTAILPIGAIFFWIKCKNTKIKYFMFGASTIALYVLRERIAGSFDTRIHIWSGVIKNSFNSVYDYCFGLGLGTFPWKDADVFNRMIENSLLQFVMLCGLVSVPVLIYLIYKLIKNYQESPACFSVISLLMLSTIEYPFEIKRLWITIISIIAFYLIETQNQTKRRTVR
jgi:hypothetical protein